jgi:hypothetical protein
MRSGPNSRSYFVPVKEGRGLWLDFNSVWSHSHDVAVVVSIQGINPLTGLPTKNALRLEQYNETCPKDGSKVEKDRYCPTCKFNWPKQNYLCTTGTPGGLMWIDGFRGEDGIVRQYLFTADSARGVAAQLIGEDRVFAIGVAFFLSEKEKPVRPPAFRSPFPDNHWDKIKGPGLPSPAPWESDFIGEAFPSKPPYEITYGSSAAKGGGVLRSMSMSRSVGLSTDARRSMADLSSSANVLRSMSVEHEPEIAAGPRLEIAAGAKIKQKVYDDPKDLSYWQKDPAGVLYVNYCHEDVCSQLIATPRVATPADGFMAGISVGN